MATNAVVASLFRASRRYPRTVRMPTINSPEAGKVASIIMPLGYTYESITIKGTVSGVPATKAQLRSDITLVKPIIDGDAKLNHSLAELDDFQRFWYARDTVEPVAEGCFTIQITRPHELTVDGQDGPGWGCAVNEQTPGGVVGGVGSFTLELTLDGAAVIDGLEVWAEVTDPAPLGRHLKIVRARFTAPYSGLIEADSWPVIDPTTGVYALHIAKAGGVAGPITTVQLQVDQQDEIPTVAYGILRAQFSRYALTQQTGYTHVAFSRRGRPLEALPMIGQSMRLILGTSAALTSYDVHLECQCGVDPAPNKAA